VLVGQHGADIVEIGHATIFACACRHNVAGMIDEVLAANQAFYDAHEHRDLAAMRAVWEHSDRAVCVHPGWPILRTWPVVEDSWRRILDGPGRNQFILTNESVAIDGDLAWVTLDENLVAGAATGTVAATNVYARVRGAWLLVVHHGSPVLA
jgi:ketosteroid isomerase-like protein